MLSAAGAPQPAAVSFRLGLQVRQVSIELVFGDSLAALELTDAAPDLRIDCFAVLREPTILFLLSFEQAEQHLLDARGAGCLELLLDSGFQSGITDFDVHRWLLERR
jgi:hypothetical protein